MSIKLMSVAWQLPLPHTEKIVLLALADNANDQGICWPSLSSICDKASLSERAVQGCIRQLESCCCLSVERRPGKGNVFTVHPQRYSPPHVVRDSTPAQSAPVPPQDMRGTPAAYAGHPRTTCATTPAPDAPPPAGYAGASKEEPSSNRQREPSRKRNARQHEAWQQIREVYPRGIYRDCEWLIAERHYQRLVEQGEVPDRIFEAVTLYRAQQLAKQAVGTQYVLAPSKFFADDRWRGPFPLPLTKADVRLAGNMTAMQEFIEGTTQ